MDYQSLIVVRDKLIDVFNQLVLSMAPNWNISSFVSISMPFLNIYSSLLTQYFSEEEHLEFLDKIESVMQKMQKAKTREDEIETYRMTLELLRILFMVAARIERPETVIDEVEHAAEMAIEDLILGGLDDRDAGEEDDGGVSQNADTQQTS